MPPLVASSCSTRAATASATASSPPAGPGLQLLRAAKDRTPVVQKNAGASLVDLGDGVLAVELHSKMNAIGGDTVQMLQAGLKEAAANFSALVVGTDAPNFSAGANLMLVLLEAQEGNWDEIDLMVRMFQQTTLALRYSRGAGRRRAGRPGARRRLRDSCCTRDRVQAAAETYIGLVEVGVGLIPAGGGTKEMVRARAATAPLARRPIRCRSSRRRSRRSRFAKVSTSAAHARQLGYLRDHDRDHR